jgi:D-arabinose 1-dehydrogenase-like Zn-dependent alcohol dehydrogenase
VHRWGSPPIAEDLPVPRANENEVLVQVEACGVGMTVLNCIRGDLADDPVLLPRVPGHEIVGRVVAAGPGVGSELVGRRVIAYFYLSCGRCMQCIAGDESRCRDLAGWVGVHRDGGYARYAVLPAFNAIPIPEGIDVVDATVIPDAVATAIHVCRRRAGIGMGDRIAVIGAAGGVGIHVAQVARLCGGDVVCLDIGDPKLFALAELGFDAIDSTDFDEVGRSWKGPPPDVVIDLLGTDPSLTWATASLGIGGRLIVLTTFRDRITSLDPRRVVLGELSIVGSKYASRAELMAAADLVGSGQIVPVIGQAVESGELLDLHEAIREGSVIGRGALRW